VEFARKPEISFCEVVSNGDGVGIGTQRGDLQQVGTFGHRGAGTAVGTAVRAGDFALAGIGFGCAESD